MLRLKVCTTIASLLVGLLSRPRHPAAEPHSLLYEFHYTCLFVCKCFLFFAEDNPEDAKKRRHTSNQPAPQPLSLHPASCLCLHPPRALLSRHQSILRGVNSRGVGVRESHSALLPHVPPWPSGVATTCLRARSHSPTPWFSLPPDLLS